MHVRACLASILIPAASLPHGQGKPPLRACVREIASGGVGCGKCRKSLEAEGIGLGWARLGVRDEVRWNGKDGLLLSARRRGHWMRLVDGRNEEGVVR
ncbi:hypothetical protein N431DRAFT_428067 [Stipitochalara longipes BDJ]|nr:hypothetical protein N431DRAFT_428067 [Stipitochalara longipes BDJ]